MKKTSASIYLALFLDFLFSLLFVFFLLSIKNNKEEVPYYMNQIGIFEEQENASKTISKLKKINLNGYTYKKDDLFIVVTSITLDKSKCLDEQDILNKNNIGYIQKEIITSDIELIDNIKNNKLEIVMELMSE